MEEPVLIPEPIAPEEVSVEVREMKETCIEEVIDTEETPEDPQPGPSRPMNRAERRALEKQERKAAKKHRNKEGLMSTVQELKKDIPAGKDVKEMMTVGNTMKIMSAASTLKDQVDLDTEDSVKQSFADMMSFIPNKNAMVETKKMLAMLEKTLPEKTFQRLKTQVGKSNTIKSSKLKKIMADVMTSDPNA